MTTLFPNPSQTSLPLNPTPPPTPSLNLDSSTFVEIASRGPGFSPLTFDDPTFYGGTRLDNVTIFNPNDQTYKKFNNVLTRTDWNGQQSAYYIHRLLKKCIYGKVTLAVVLVPHEVQPANPTRDPNAPPLSQSNNFSINNVVWRFTTISINSNLQTPPPPAPRSENSEKEITRKTPLRKYPQCKLSRRTAP